MSDILTWIVCLEKRGGGTLYLSEVIEGRNGVVNRFRYSIDIDRAKKFSEETAEGWVRRLVKARYVGVTKRNMK